MVNCVWDINRNYLISKTDGEPMPLGKRYLVLNLRDKQHRLAAIAFAEKSLNLELAKDLKDRVQANENLDDFLAKREAARHSNNPFWWIDHPGVPSLSILDRQKRPGLYAKYQIRDSNADCVEGDFFVLSVQEESSEIEAALNCLN